MRTRADTPVFVDHSGQRRRFVVALGAAAGVALILAAVVLVLGLTGAGPAKIPGWPEGAPGGGSPTPAIVPQKAPSATGQRTTAPSGSRPPGAATGASGAAAATPTAGASTTSRGNGNGNGSTHTPTAHPSKGR
jgi:hypothetical protein